MPSRKIEDISGQRFNKWVVIKRVQVVHTTKSRHTHWLCKCDCGNKAIVSKPTLKNGDSTRCLECKYKSFNIPGARAYTFMFCQVKIRAKDSNLEFNLNKEEVLELLKKQNYKCKISGINIKLAKTLKEHKNRGTTASIDRIDSNKGYTIDNIQWVHKDINIMKNKHSLEYFLYLCRSIYEENFKKDDKFN